MGIWKWEVGNSQNFSIFSKKLNCTPRNEKWDSNKNSHFQSFPLGKVHFYKIGPGCLTLQTTWFIIQSPSSTSKCRFQEPFNHSIWDSLYPSERVRVREGGELGCSFCPSSFPPPWSPALSPPRSAIVGPYTDHSTISMRSRRENTRAGREKEQEGSLEKDFFTHQR